MKHINKEPKSDYLIEEKRQAKVQRRQNAPRRTIRIYQPKSEEVVEGTRTPNPRFIYNQ